jgi:type IV secretory pathway TrbF-like protein
MESLTQTAVQDAKPAQLLQPQAPTAPAPQDQKPREASTAAGPAAVKSKSAGESKLPKWFEVFGSAVAEVLFLRNLVVGLGGVIILLLISVVRLANKPPLVIRVDDLREPISIKDLQSDSEATAPEVRNFVDHFTRYLLSWDLYTLGDDLDRAMTMMTPAAAGKMKQYLNGIQVGRQTREDALRTKVIVQEITVDKDSPHVVRVKVRGSRIAQSYEKKELHRETIFEDTLVLRKVDRSQTTPWGLSVEDWQEAIFKTEGGQTP